MNNTVETVGEIDSIIDHIFEGKEFVQNPDNENHFECIRQDFISRISSIEGFEKLFQSCASDLDKINLIQKYYKWAPIHSDYIKKFDKNAEISTGLREKANSAFKKSDFISSLRGYNLSIMFAPKGSAELGYGYSNRSALLAHVGKIQESLDDIQEAEKYLQKDKLPKLLERKAKYLEILAKKKNSEQTMVVDELKYFENLLRIKNPNPEIPGTENFVQIGYSEECGRRLTVSKDVSSGTLLLCECPFVTSLTNELLWDTEHCHFCTKRIYRGIQCNFCTFAFFCDEKCFQEACSSFHQYEHSILSYLHSSGFYGHITISTRIIFKLGPQKLLEMFKNQENYFNSNINFDDPIKPVYNLITHQDSNCIKSVSEAFKSLHMTHLIKNLSNFFDKFLTNEDFFNFIASLIFHFARSLPFNLMSLNELVPVQSSDYFSGDIKLGQVTSSPFGAALFGLLSFLNHSCCPNAIHVKVPWLQATCIVALKHLKPSDEIRISYGPLHNSTLDKIDRQKILQEKYRFTCQCPACQGNWPKDLSTCDETILSQDPRKILEMEKKLQFIQKDLYKAQELLGKGDTRNLLESLRILKNVLEFISVELSEPSFLFQVGQELYKKSLILTIYKANSAMFNIKNALK